MIIYRLISPSNKSYIGKSIRKFENRYRDHIYQWKTRKYKSKLFNAFDKYPPETWKVEILYSCLSEEELNDKERYYIKYYDSIDYGYNICRGGEGGSHPQSEETRKS